MSKQPRKLSEEQKEKMKAGRAKAAEARKQEKALIKKKVEQERQRMKIEAEAKKEQSKMLKKQAEISQKERLQATQLKKSAKIKSLKIKQELNNLNDSICKSQSEKLQPIDEINEPEDDVEDDAVDDDCVEKECTHDPNEIYKEEINNLKNQIENLKNQKQTEKIVVKEKELTRDQIISIKMNEIAKNIKDDKEKKFFYNSVASWDWNKDLNHNINIFKENYDKIKCLEQSEQEKISSEQRKLKKMEKLKATEKSKLQANMNFQKLFSY